MYVYTSGQDNPSKENPTSIKASPTEIQAPQSGIWNNIPESMYGGVLTTQKGHNCLFAIFLLLMYLEGLNVIEYAINLIV